uniref:DH domain-containing protein n=1 Tax=Lutzomyia longipalpis TaxID=7200 RepID=A0A1B0CP37_LUTLO
MFRKHGRNGCRSNRDSGVASISSIQSVHDSCRMFYKIYDLIVCEEKYVRMLEILTCDYKKQFILAMDPYHYFPIDLTSFRALCGQERKIFFFFEQLLQLHRTFCDLLHECDDAVDIGRIFYDWIVEGKLDIYVKHWLINPLRRLEVQQEFDAFMEQCRDEIEITGVQAYLAPDIHLMYYKKILSSLCEICASTEDLESLQTVERSLGVLNTFLDSCKLSSNAMDMENLAADVVANGKCLYRGEFAAREYAEGLKEKVIIYLFERGLIVATPKKCPKSHAVNDFFHSYCDLRHIEVAPMEASIRLKDMTSGKTYYRLKKKQSTFWKNKDTSSMAEIIQTISMLKGQEDTETYGKEWGDSQPPVEAINYNLVHRMQIQSFSLRLYGYSPQSTPSYSEKNPTYVEVHNVAVIEKFMLQHPVRMKELSQRMREKMEQFVRIQAIDRERYGDWQQPGGCVENDCDSGSDSSFEI